MYTSEQPEVSNLRSECPGTMLRAKAVQAARARSNFGARSGTLGNRARTSGETQETASWNTLLAVRVEILNCLKRIHQVTEASREAVLAIDQHTIETPARGVGF